LRNSELKKELMSKVHKSIITENLTALCNSTNTDKLFTPLIAAGVIDINDEQDILSRPNTASKNRYLYLNIMLSKSEYDFYQLIDCLKKTKQEAVAEILGAGEIVTQEMERRSATAVNQDDLR